MDKRQKHQFSDAAKATEHKTKHQCKKERRKKGNKVFTWVMLIAIVAPVIIGAVMALYNYFL